MVETDRIHPKAIPVPSRFWVKAVQFRVIFFRIGSVPGGGGLALAAFLYVGCDSGSSGDDHFRLINESSVPVSILPDRGETLQAFVLQPGETESLEVGIEHGDNLDYMYGPASQVTAKKISGTKVIFTDPVAT